MTSQQVSVPTSAPATSTLAVRLYVLTLVVPLLASSLALLIEHGRTDPDPAVPCLVGSLTLVVMGAARRRLPPRSALVVVALLAVLALGSPLLGIAVSTVLIIEDILMMASTRQLLED